jgi:hypothetical protein
MLASFLWANIGKNIDTSDHKSYELFGIPSILARLEDSIFEGLPKKQQQLWPEQFLSSINVGADLFTIWPKFVVWLLIDKKFGVIQYAKNKQQRLSIQKVADLYKNGGTPKEFKNAADAAQLAAAAADATSWASDGTATATAAAAADDDAAATSYAADAAYAARYNARIAQSKKLISLLKACK